MVLLAGVRGGWEEAEERFLGFFCKEQEGDCIALGSATGVYYSTA